eukprot:1159645-Pelagomonas_calceolata.AAC.5
MARARIRTVMQGTLVARAREKTFAGKGMQKLQCAVQSSDAWKALCLEGIVRALKLRCTEMLYGCPLLAQMR